MQGAREFFLNRSNQIAENFQMFLNKYGLLNRATHEAKNSFFLKVTLDIERNRRRKYSS